MRWLLVLVLALLLFVLPSASAHSAEHSRSHPVQTTVPIPRERPKLVLAGLAPQMAVSVDLSLIFQLLEIVAIVGSFIWTSFKLGGRVEKFESHVSAMQMTIQELKEGMLKLDNVITQIAVSNTRMDNMDMRLDDMIKGRISWQGEARGRK